MERELVRLELLKLTYTHGRDANDAVERAKVLESYVLPEDKANNVPAKTASKPSKKAGNLDILS